MNALVARQRAWNREVCVGQHCVVAMAGRAAAEQTQVAVDIDEVAKRIAVGQTSTAIGIEK